MLTFATEEITSTEIYEQNKCSGEEELANCKIQMPDNPSTADMNEAHYKFADCTIAVAYKLFDQNYKKYNDRVKKNFDTLVKVYYAYAMICLNIAIMVLHEAEPCIIP